MPAKTKIFTAKKIITMCPEQPFADTVAVLDGRVLSVGWRDEVLANIKKSPFAACEIDSAFENNILMPGLVDAHTHVELQALIYSGHFVAQIPWPRPEGGFYPVYPKKKEVLARLRELDSELAPGEPLYAVAYDENKAGGYLHIEELDQVSNTRPILVSNLVFHRFWANTALLKQAGVLSKALPPGVLADENGRPNGTLIEAKGLIAVVPALPDLVNLTVAKIRYVLPLFVRGGITTACDAAMGAFGFHPSIDRYQNLLALPDNRLRVVGLPWAKSGVAEAGSIDDFIAMVKEKAAEAKDPFHIGPVKLYTDGSIVSHTSPTGWPGYWDGTPEGHMENDPEEIREWLIRCHAAGLATITHANSRPGCRVVLDAVKAAQAVKCRPDMRHRIDHAYNITTAQLRQAAALGVTVQFFTPQIYYYGDAHLGIQGLDRARHITPTGTARRLGVSWGFHNDPPGTPQLPWVGAWATVHRKTMKSGTVLGPEHCVTVDEALRAMTVEAAFQLHLDHLVGSIEFGKRADFCVLEADPFEIDPLELKDMPVWGTVFGGDPNPAGT